MAGFSGKTDIETAVSFPSAKLKRLKNPRLAILWHLYGYHNELAISNLDETSTQPPFPFSVQLTEPPILDSSFVAFGQLCLFSDVNGDGKLLRSDVLHPDKVFFLDTLNLLYSRMIAEKEKMASAGRVEENSRDSSHILFFNPRDRIFWLGTKKGGDTLFADTENFTSATVLPSFLRQFRRLMNWTSPWELFFEKRQTAEIFSMTTLREGDSLEVLQYKIPQRLFAAKKSRKAFLISARTYLETVMELSIRNIRYERVNSERDLDDYMGEMLPGKDWVAGMTQAFHILFFGTRKEFSEMERGYASSVLQVGGLDQSRLGYNLLYCREPYDCRVSDWSDSIIIGMIDDWAGLSDGTVPNEVIDAPQDPLVLDSATLESYAGAYLKPEFAWNSAFAAYDGSLWIKYDPINIMTFSLPDYGCVRLLSLKDSSFIPSIMSDLKIEFRKNDSGSVTKSRLEIMGQTITSAKMSDSSASDFIESVKIVANRKVVELPGSVWTDYQGEYQYTSQENVIIYSQSGQTGGALSIKIPQLKSNIILPASKTVYYSHDFPLRVEFFEGGNGGIGRLVLTLAGTEITMPNQEYAPAFASDLNGLSRLSTSAGIASRSSGAKSAISGAFSCGDGKYLGPGDGWVSEAATGDAGSPAPSFLVFEVPGLPDNKISLTLGACLPGTEDTALVRIGVLGGSHPDSLSSLLQDEMDFSLTGSGGSLEFSPLRILSDPYYIKTYCVVTGYTQPVVAFDSYMMKAQPAEAQ